MPTRQATDTVVPSQFSRPALGSFRVTRPSRQTREPPPDIFEDVHRRLGLVRGEMVCPKRIPKEKWELVFPPDSRDVRVATGLLCMSMVPTGEAIMRAMRATDVRHADAFLANGKHASLLRPLADAFGEDAHREALADAVLGVYATLGACARILSAETPAHEAFRVRKWHAPAGRCMVCAEACGEDCKRYAGTDGVADHVHTGCVPVFSSIAKAFCAAVVTLCETRRRMDLLYLEEVQKSAAAGTCDPDDPSTYMD